MAQIKVNLGIRSYVIEIGKENLLKTDFSKYGASRYGIITDSNVRSLYGEDLQDSLRKQGLDVELLKFPAGGASKIPKKAIHIGRELARKDFDRNSMIIALGGGVVGDLAGFVASFYLRGIDFIQIPTTLLAQVDSSVGGKTGVDIPEGKNLFGAFYQPKEVIIDVKTLETLEEKEIRNGFAEIIKYGVIKDKELFRFLEQNHSSRDSEVYTKLVKRSCEIKAEIVEKDEREGELRKILNYGHTIGHAIESAKKYKISHGEAVALGMVYEGKISSKLGLLDKEHLERQNQLIHDVGLPTKYKGNLDDLIEIMRRDKKNRDGKLHFILPISIGKVREESGQIAFSVDKSFVRECMED